MNILCFHGTLPVRCLEILDFSRAKRYFYVSLHATKNPNSVSYAARFLFDCTTNPSLAGQDRVQVLYRKGTSRSLARRRWLLLPHVLWSSTPVSNCIVVVCRHRHRTRRNGWNTMSHLYFISTLFSLECDCHFFFRYKMVVNDVCQIFNANRTIALRLSFYYIHTHDCFTFHL